MQVITDINDAIAQRVADAFKAEFYYDDNKLPGETILQFCKRMTANWIKGIVANHEAKIAAGDARIGAGNLDVT